MVLLLITHLSSLSHAFVSDVVNRVHRRSKNDIGTTTSLRMGQGLDLVTYLRTEYISAALCTNQTPRAANVCLQLGVEDARAINFVPRTIRAFITSTSEPDGELGVATRRQLTQQSQRRGTEVELVFRDQASDDLSDTADETVDVVLSLQAAAPMVENGLDWKASVRESARVLRPGGRLLFVERTEIGGEKYADYVRNLCVRLEGDDDEETLPVFDDVGTDDVDLVLIPHVAGVAVKSEDAGMTKKERDQRAKDEAAEKYAEMSINAFERGRKKRRKKKKTVTATEGDGKDATK